MSAASGLQAPLMSGLDALGLAATAQQVVQLLGHLDMLLQWNRTHNLTAIRQPAEALSHHVLDCLAALPLLDWPDGTAVLDAGAGGGLPSVVWAIMRPGWQITAVDAVEKKMAFVRQCAGVLKLPNLSAEHRRLDARRGTPGLGEYDWVTSRAFASLADSTRLTRFHVKQGGGWLALKGKLPADEIAALPSFVTHEKTLPVQVPGLDEARCLVWLRPAPV